MTTREYDGIFIGGGHNAMIAAGYLARAGLKLAVVERMVEIGGGLDSHEDTYHPGFWHNIHSVFHRGVGDLMWFKDLEMADHGQVYIKPEVGVSMLTRDHDAIIWYKNPEQTIAQFAKYSQQDAKQFREFHQAYQPVIREILMPETYAAPLPMDQKREILAKSAVGREYLRFADQTVEEVILDHFENETVRAFLGFLCMMRGYELHSRGQGYWVPSMIAWGVNPHLSKGSSHSLAHKLHKMVTRYGVDLIEAAPVAEIIVEDGAAKGVRIADGRIIKARHFVASSINPQQTFLELIGEAKLDPAFAKKVEGFKYSPTTPIYAVNLALHEPPKYLSAEKEPDVARSFMIICGIDEYQDLFNLDKALRAGELPPKLFMNGACPSLHDPSQAPPGKHVAFMWQLCTPYLADGGPAKWDEIRWEFFERELAMWRSYAPNLDEKNIIGKDAATPVDIERHLPNMRGGDWMVGEYNENQMLDRRPFPECSQYRTPVKNLYLCGSSCHPGGNITGGPGHNAAGAIADDLGVQKWWNPHDVVDLWSKLT